VNAYAYNKDKGIGFTRTRPPKWTAWIPIRVKAMVSTADTLFIAGAPDVFDEKDDPLGALEGRKGGLLRAVSKIDGWKLAEYRLDAPPVLDGLIAARGKLYLATRDGRLTCWRKWNRTGLNGQDREHPPRSSAMTNCVTQTWIHRPRAGSEPDEQTSRLRTQDVSQQQLFEPHCSRTAQRRAVSPFPTAIVPLVLLAMTGMTHAGETLHNGIVLPDQWPPDYDRQPREPMPVPYLKTPPAVIPIDVGRQLLVDDFLIEDATLDRTFHTPEYHPANPVLKPDKPWENKSKGWFAAPFSGGAWYDPADKLFKLWYTGGYLSSTCYATSKDGIKWEKPQLDVEEGTNIVLEPVKKGTHRVDTTTIWLDFDTKDPKRRFKYFATEAGGGWGMTYRTSADGVHWSEPFAERHIWGDRTTVFYNPFRKVWVLSERIGWGGRARAYSEDADPQELIAKSKGVKWVAADGLDPTHTVKELARGPELYNVDAAPYESLMIGFFSIWQGPSNNYCGRLNLQKRNDILLGFSRDGFHWDRPHRKRFIASSWENESWRFGNVQSVGGGCLVVGDNLYFYFSGRARPDSGKWNTDTDKSPGGWDADAATGLAILRRDGFASMDAGEQVGTLTTRPLTFKGKYLHVNVDCPNGELKAEVLNRDGKPIEPFTTANCSPVSCDKTLAAVAWQGAADLSAVVGKKVRFRFHLNDGSIYAFWVSPDKSGASHGYVAAGGPGFTDATDTVGQAGDRKK
jgi:hypothetical protein